LLGDYLFVPSKCKGGIQRVHIIKGCVDGSLLLELFTGDGEGTMIARYFEALVL
jgi:acetylglutamate kinase